MVAIIIITASPLLSEHTLISLPVMLISNCNIMPLQTTFIFFPIWPIFLVSSPSPSSTALTHSSTTPGSIKLVINPFTALHCPSLLNFRAEKCTRTPANSIFYRPVTNRFQLLRVLVEDLSNANAKNKTKMLKHFKFHTFIVCF